MNVLTGRVHWLQAKVVGRQALRDLYKGIAASYPNADTIYMVQDNWPVHFHPDVLAALEPQQWPWKWHVPGNWSTEPHKDVERLNLKIQLLPLPTYSPWLNPIEKLWRWLKQEVIHLHEFADETKTLREKVGSFLDRFKEGDNRLLHYTGVLPP